VVTLLVVDIFVQDPLDFPSGKVQISPPLSTFGHQLLPLLGVGAGAGGGDGVGGLVIVWMSLVQLQLLFPSALQVQLSIVVVLAPVPSHDECCHPQYPLFDPPDNTFAHEDPFVGATLGQEIAILR
jgi:hypothetical protein